MQALGSKVAGIRLVGEPGFRSGRRLRLLLRSVLVASLVAVAVACLLAAGLALADGERVARLLAMPEVVSIERDRELRRPEPQPVRRTQ